MSIKNNIFLVGVIILISVFTFKVISNFSKKDQIGFQSHSGLSTNFLESKFTSRGVINRIIQLRLNFNSVKLNSEKTEIIANVNMPYDFKDKLYYKWKLSEGVVLSAGQQLEGELNGLLKNEHKNIKLEVTGFSQEINRQIRFEIFGLKNGQQIYADALVASNLENTFENIVQNVEKIKAENKD